MQMDTSQHTTDNPAVFPLRPVERMTHREALEYVARTKRQLDRIELLPGPEGETIDPAQAKAIRQMCDDLERDIRISLAAS